VSLVSLPLAVARDSPADSDSPDSESECLGPGELRLRVRLADSEAQPQAELRLPLAGSGSLRVTGRLNPASPGPLRTPPASAGESTLTPSPSRSRRARSRRPPPRERPRSALGCNCHWQWQYLNAFKLLLLPGPARASLPDSRRRRSDASAPRWQRHGDIRVRHHRDRTGSHCDSKSCQCHCCGSVLRLHSRGRVLPRTDRSLPYSTDWFSLSTGMPVISSSSSKRFQHTWLRLGYRVLVPALPRAGHCQWQWQCQCQCQCQCQPE